MNQLDYQTHLPPYRSLLNPNAKYDYQLHSLIPISQNELNHLKLLFKGNQQKPSLKMKYKSLLNDVNRKISMKISNPNFLQSQSPIPIAVPPPSTPSQCSFKSLPIEIQYHIFLFLSKRDLTCTLTVNRHFYKISKKFLYKTLEFDLSFRFAQFITILRINGKLGNLVELIDLSNLKPCNYETEQLLNQSSMDLEEENELLFVDHDDIKAGWRDWKFMRNPLYSRSLGLSKVVSNAPSSHSSKSSESRRRRLNFSFLKTKRNKPNQPVLHQLANNAGHRIHPSINRFLISFSNTKDLPVGYILHLLTLCPNLTCINLGNLQLSTDYEINPNFMYKFQTFDIINNYPSNMLRQVNDIDDSGSIYNMFETRFDMDNMSLLSTSSRSVQKPSQPVRKYTSLLAPVPNMNYINKNNGKMYLSDLNLKSINQNYLSKVNEFDILNLLIKRHKFNINFNYLDLSSMIWLNKKLVQSFLAKFLKVDNSDIAKRNLVIDLTNSGMYKDLVWAKRIDLNTDEGIELINTFLKGELLNDWELRLRNDRIRRGRMAENYFN